MFAAGSVLLVLIKPQLECEHSICLKDQQSKMTITETAACEFALLSSYDYSSKLAGTHIYVSALEESSTWSSLTPDRYIHKRFSREGYRLDFKVAAGTVEMFATASPHHQVSNPASMFASEQIKLPPPRHRYDTAEAALKPELLILVSSLPILAEYQILI